MKFSLKKIYFTGLATLYTFKNDQRGVTAIEYAVIAVAISALMLVVFSTDTTKGLGKALVDAMDKISTMIGSVGTTTPGTGGTS